MTEAISRGDFFSLLHPTFQTFSFPNLSTESAIRIPMQSYHPYKHSLSSLGILDSLAQSPFSRTPLYPEPQTPSKIFPPPDGTRHKNMYIYIYRASPAYICYCTRNVMFPSTPELSSLHCSAANALHPAGANAVEFGRARKRTLCH